MEITNITAEDSQTPFQDFFCSTEFAKGRNHQLIVLTALNIFVSVTAFLGNALILAALHKESSLHPPSKLLFRNLATTDLAVGIIVAPFFVAYLIFLMNQQWNICRFAFLTLNILGYNLCGVSLLTLAAISVDRLLALLLGLRYRQVVTLKRIYVIVILFWCVCIIGSAMYFWNPYITFWFGRSVLSLCLVISVCSYAKIFFTLHHSQVQAQGHQTRNHLPNRARYKKTVYTALWVKLALVVCYLPYAAREIIFLQSQLSPTVAIADLFTTTLVLLNSSLNPILYCWKIREVSEVVKEIVKGMFCA